MRNGSCFVGLLQKEDDSYVVLRVAYDVLPLTLERVSIDNMHEVEESAAPAIIYTDRRDMVLGGVGIHTRRCTYADSEDGEIGAILTNFGDIEYLQNCVSSLEGMVRFTSIPPELIEEDGEYLCTVVVKGECLSRICFNLGLRNIYLYAPGLRPASMMHDSLNRARHLYAQQVKFMSLEAVGPTRALWRFRFAHLPPHWKLPFSWPAWALNVLDDLDKSNRLHRINELEMPLRALVEEALYARRGAVEEQNKKRLHDMDDSIGRMQLSMQRLGEDRDAVLVQAAVQDLLALSGRGAHHTMAAKILRNDVELPIIWVQEEVERTIEWMAQQRVNDIYTQPEALPHYVTPALSEKESEKMMDAFHCWYYNYDGLQPDDREIKKARMLHGPMTHGYYTHWISAYELTGEFVGYGENLRNPLTIDAPVPPAARNRMRVVGNMLQGRGTQGYKGLFDAPPEQSTYDPKRQLMRTELDNVQLRRGPWAA